MELDWTPWARTRLLPVPGRDPFEIDLTDTLTLGAMPFDELLELGVAQRVPERYNEKGNHPSDRHGDNIVDTCVATGGVQLATKFLFEVCGRAANGRYLLRQDARPWGRLRQHLAAASAEAREEAKALATPMRAVTDQRKHAAAFAFCDPDWVREDLPAALDEGYGLLALLTSLESAEQARDALTKLVAVETPLYQIIEEGVWFMPNLLRTLEASDVDRVVEIARLAWNKQVRKPWLEVVACLPGANAKAFLAEHGYEMPVTKPAAKSVAMKSTAKKSAAKKSPAKKSAAKKSPVKKSAVKKPATNKSPASKKPAKRR